MHIITRKRLLEFATKHPTVAKGLEHWYRVIILQGRQPLTLPHIHALAQRFGVSPMTFV